MTHLYRWKRLGLITLLCAATLATSMQTRVARADEAVILAVGDIAVCSSDKDEQTAALVAQTGGVVITLGDTVYPDGSEKSWNECFEPSWGPLKDRIHPTPGNHDYQRAGDPPYFFQYFGNFFGGRPGKGWYSFNAAGWHVVVLNSMEPDGRGTDQNEWLKADLANNPTNCILAAWHHPRFNSGAGGLTNRMVNSFRLLYEYGASVLLSGDAHHYERFVPMNVNRQIQKTRGIRQFIVGTGGAYLYKVGPKWRATEARDNATHGILKLTLRPGSYDWEFIPITPDGFKDSGTALCSVKE